MDFDSVSKNGKPCILYLLFCVFISDKTGSARFSFELLAGVELTNPS